MMEVIKENVKLTERVTQKHLLQKLLREKLGLNDVLSIEYKQRSQRKINKERDYGMIEFHMKRKLKDATEDELEKRKDYKVAKSKLYEIVKHKSKSAKEFRMLQGELIGSLYAKKRVNNKKKVAELREVQNQ